LSALAEHADTPIQRGIAALQKALGEDNAFALLKPAPLKTGEAACFSFPLPIDYTGEARWLRIGFPTNFPQEALKLHVEPSPWLIWPHAMESGLCLHGFQERPITGTPEFIVEDSLSRLAKIVALSERGSNAESRDTEFQNEITSYWFSQHGQSLQNLILLNRPHSASRLFALSDPRQALPSGQETVWLATDTSVLKKHYKRMVGSTVTIRAAETPGFYVKLQSYPDIRFPAPENLLPWLTPHLTTNAAKQLASWFKTCSSLISRWIALELPGESSAPIYCLNIRSSRAQSNRGTKFNLRSARRRPAMTVNNALTIIRSTTLDVLDRKEILSRDLSGVATSLEDSRVVCIGVGSLGSSVAMQLARSGVGHLTLIDYETLVSANLGRHVLGADDLGKAKAVALREKILKDLPTVEVAAHATFAEVVLQQKPEVFEKADLVVITTAEWQSEASLWKAKSDGTSWRLIQAWGEPHAQVGHVLLATAGAFDARHLFSESGDFRHKFTEWPEGGIVPLPACGGSFIPGGSLGMTSIAAMVSQTALRALTGRISDATWISSINRPQDIAILGGIYHGPELPEGLQQVLLERGWPKPMDGAE
jgi:hypothetical protein